MSVLKNTWTQCTQTHSALFQLVPKGKWESIDYFHTKAFDANEDIYQDTLDYMAECLEAIEPAVRDNSFSHNKKVSFCLHFPYEDSYKKISKKINIYRNFSYSTLTAPVACRK